VTAGITKEGRFFCGFNDTGFPGSSATVGTYAAPAYPFQVFNEASQASKIVSVITKEGRGIFGLGGTMPSGAAAHPIEVYNEATGATCMAYISKAGMIRTAATVGGTAHVARLDCADISMSTGPTAQAVQLREMVMPYKDGSTVKGKLTQVMCGVGYGATIDLTGLPSGATAYAVLACNQYGTPGWVSTVQLLFE